MLCYPLAAQGTVMWGTALGESDPNMELAICSDTECYLYDRTKSTIVMVRVEGDLREVARAELRLTHEEGDLQFQEFRIVEDLLVAFARRKNKGTKRHEMLAKAFERETLLSIAEWRVVVEETGSPRSLIEPFGLHVPLSSNKVLITCPLQVKTGEGERLSMHVLDGRLNNLWHGEAWVAPGQVMPNEQVLMDGEGKVYFLYRWYGSQMDAKAFKSEQSPYGGYCLYRYGPEGDRDSVLYLNKDHFMLNMRVSFDTLGNQLFGAGFYSFGRSAGCRGALSFMMDMETMEVKDKQQFEFTDEFLRRWLSDAEEKRWEKVSAKWGSEKFHSMSYEVRDLWMGQDGGLTVVAEQSYVTVILGESQRAHKDLPPPLMYFTNDAMVLHIDEDDGSSWVAGLPKRQFAPSTLKYCRTQQGIALLYKDRRSNLNATPGTELDPIGSMSPYARSTKPDELTMLAWITPDAAVHKRAFPLPEDGLGSDIPLVFLPFGNGRMLVKAKTSQGPRYGVLQF
jgi:hypothetical protein